MRVSCPVEPLEAPEIVATTSDATATVVIGKLAVVAPAATVTVAGTVAAAELEVSVMG